MLVDIEGYEGRYKVSNDGYVFSCNVNRKLKVRISNCGYPRVVLYDNGKPKAFSIHRLVALHFIANPENKLTVNHKDGNKANCYADNLEWSTQSENIEHAYDTGLIGYINSNKNGKLSGEGNGRSKVTLSKVSEIRLKRKQGVSVKSICSLFGLSNGQVYNIINHVSWA